MLEKKQLVCVPLGGYYAASGGSKEGCAHRGRSRGHSQALEGTHGACNEAIWPSLCKYQVWDDETDVRVELESEVLHTRRRQKRQRRSVRKKFDLENPLQLCSTTDIQPRVPQTIENPAITIVN